MTPATTFLLLTLAPAADMPPANPSVADIEAFILKSRRSIVWGKVSLEEKYTSPSGKKDKEFTDTLWFDFEKDKFRNDKVSLDKGTTPFRHIVGINCERTNYYVDYWDMRGEDSSRTVELKPLTAKRREYATGIYDPRLLGLLPLKFTLLYNHHLEEAIGCPDRDQPKLRRERWQNADCWVISYHNLRGTYFEQWVSPSQGYSVVRSVLEDKDSGQTFRDVVETENAPVGNSGIWFPRSCVYESFEDGKPLGKREVVRITEVSFNEPMNDQVFTLAGMNIAPDTVIDGEQPDGKKMVWDWTGESVVDHVNPAFLPTQVQAGSDRRTWLIIAAVGLAIVMTLALVLYWRSGRKKAA